MNSSLKLHSLGSAKLAAVVSLNFAWKNLSVFCHFLTSKCCFLGTFQKAHVQVSSTESCFPGSLPTLAVLSRDSTSPCCSRCLPGAPKNQTLLALPGTSPGCACTAPGRPNPCEIPPTTAGNLWQSRMALSLRMAADKGCAVGE